VVEFGAFAAGPMVGKYLADFGAVVVHVESRTRPDGLRRNYPPFKDNRPDPDGAGWFAFCNDTKFGVTLNLKHPRARELARRLVRWADVLIENYAPGVMRRLGLDYPEVCRENPQIMYLSTCNMGQTGPKATQKGFGSQTDVVVIPGVRAHPMDPTARELVPPGGPYWNRVGGKVLIDATKPPLCAGEEARKPFQRLRPMGWDRVRLEDFLRELGCTT
jgi:hypothetical protein